MSNDLNQCSFIGRLGKEVDIRYSQSGTAFASFSLACGDKYKDKQGDLVEKTEWVNVCVIGKLAEVCGTYLTKGSQVFIQGKMKTRKWQDKNGQDRYTTEVIVDGFDGKMQMLGGRSGQSEGGFQQQQQQQQPAQAPQGGQPAQNTGGFNQVPQQQTQKRPMAEHDFDFDDDIPF